MSYEEEYKRLEIWFWEERDKIDAMPSSGGLDGPRSSAGAALGREVTKRLKALKEKYNITE